MADSDKHEQAEVYARLEIRLSLERTFLTWLRAGTGLITVGLAIASFLPSVGFFGAPLKTIIAAIFVVEGLSTLFLGLRRYVRYSERLGGGAVRGATGDVAVAIGLACLTGLMAIVFVVLKDIR